MTTKEAGAVQDRIEIYRRVERQYLRDKLGALSLQTVDGMVLRLAAREGRMCQEDIAKRVVLDKGAVARAVARLEERGLVERVVPDRCRREKLVSLTPAGEDVFQAIETALQEWNRICYQGFSPEERAEYDAFLTRITENVVKFKREEQNG